MTSLLTGSAVLVTGGNRRGNDNYGFGYSCLETTGARMKRTFQSATTAFIEVSKDGHRFADFFDLQAHVSHSRGDDFVGNRWAMLCVSDSGRRCNPRAKPHKRSQSLTGSDLSVQIPKKVSEVTLQYKICRSSHKSWKISTKLGFLTDTAAQGSAQPTEQTVVDTVL
ncbi:hypothetical protein FGSG_05056 [Fusarium graminearum PH-1]|uniref:Chromosome 3, complete genome n=1 Tax=Gibberella zeae (strain ATCC MYA-4620 / CBS 123657 / FGSC 9075 / NRRL 31084 / PH-1) TaxID=229533 RepID=I1RM73_GIBZE|nr:hypothetical protein FGSG_05056 [Fusarium graminearum PH-1]ESU10964.1 hypothetical protein FGSG_05056 [Fusarium graminearum PH-1]CEF87949.1 unnamed protein product [Fusarium graminearum]|eukprot:XP_011323540.1 hypothetical protein FGSG_05056 [Fusarium graminearum PH-1]